MGILSDIFNFAGDIGTTASAAPDLVSSQGGAGAAGILGGLFESAAPAAAESSSFLSDFLLDKDILSAGLGVTGSLVSNLLNQSAASDAAAAAQDQANALNTIELEEREKDRQLKLALAQIAASAGGGGASGPDPKESFTRMAGRLLEGGRTEQASIANLINANTGILG